MKTFITMCLLFVQACSFCQTENQEKLELIRLRLEQKFELLSGFDSAALIAVFSKDGEYGYIDTLGQELRIKIPAGVHSPFSFINGYGIIESVSNNRHIFYILDRKGRVLNRLDGLTGIREWQNIDRIIASDKSGRHGVIDRNGKIIIPFKYYLLESAGDNFLKAYAGESTVYKAGIITYRDEKIIPAVYDEIYFYNHSSSYLLASKNNSLLAIRGKQQVFVLGKSTTSGSLSRSISIDYKNGLILNKAFQKDTLYDLQLRVNTAITGKFDEISFISEGIIGVRNWLNKTYDSAGQIVKASGGEFKYLNGKGMPISSGAFGDGTAFVEGYSTVTQVFDNRGLYGFMDTAGVLQIPCVYSKVTNFRNGYARVQKDDLFFIIDKKGKFVMESRAF